MMNKIPKQLIKDYMIAGCTLVCILLVLHPIFLTPEKRAVPLLVFKMVHAVFFLSTLIVSEIVVTYIFKKPFSYSDSISNRLWHFILCAVIGAPLFNVFLNQSNTIMMFDFLRFHYAWIDTDESFTLKWYLKTLDLCFITATIMVIAMMVISRIRCIQNSLRELVAINEILERKQEELYTYSSIDNAADTIILHGDSRDSLVVNPHDIVYVESIANYLNIVYFNDANLCNKRLRSSLRDVEEALEAFPFMVRTHRAFLVNIHFITQVTGNSAGMKVSLFSCDKVIPVSRSNIGEFKMKISEKTL